MNRKMMLKISIDLVMTIVLLCQMAYMLIGEAIHEWTGTAMFLLFILHHILNWRWYKNLTTGKYTAFRVLQTIINFLILISMIGLMVSGIIMSREVFAFLPIEGGMSFARTLHMLTAYWGFILMSMHLGLHWGMILSMIQKLTQIKKQSPLRNWIIRTVALLVCLFGMYAFLKNNIIDYLFLNNQFVFFNMQQSLFLFFLEYIAMMSLWACISYYVSQILNSVYTKLC